MNYLISIIAGIIALCFTLASAVCVIYSFTDGWEWVLVAIALALPATVCIAIASVAYISAKEY
jgi:hypothetical protein